MADKERQAIKKAIKTASDDQAISLSQAAIYLRISYNWAWQLMKDAGVLVECEVPSDPRGKYVSVKSVRARKDWQKLQDTLDTRMRKSLDEKGMQKRLDHEGGR
jgi:hypothetical protein